MPRQVRTPALNPGGPTPRATSRRARSAARTAMQMAEISLAAPQVIAHRLARMAAHGARPGKRDRAELHRMGAEKVAAFGEAVQAMWTTSLAMAARAWTQWWMQALTPFGWLRPWSARLPRHAGDALLAAAVQPVHRRVRGNLRRLSGLRRRFGLR